MVTHGAFSDESSLGNFESIGMITLPIENLEAFELAFVSICSNHGFNNPRDIKWHELRSADLRLCILEVMDLVFKCVIGNGLRIDVIIWDTGDSRHNVFGRDDAKNFAIMYYNLLKNVIMKRWPDGAIWEIYPDRNNTMHWDKLVEILNNKGIILSISKSNQGKVKINLRNNFELKIIPSTPTLSPLIQLADLFAGMGIYSRECFKKFEEWELLLKGQSRLIPLPEERQLSRRDKERCFIINSFKTICDKNKLGVSFKSTKGLQTHNPTKPINFWFYIPQHKNDKAPTK
jgi:hypothetical protein